MPPGGARTPADFRRVALRVKPVAESFCREEAPSAPPDYCDFKVVLDGNPRMPPNAFQTRDENGRPVVVMGENLLIEMRSDDEIAFVLSHEMSHHIAGHIPKQQQQQVLGALILGGIVAAAGNPYGAPASDRAIEQAMDVGAYVGARAYSQSYELEADTIGAFVAVRAGYDPERGAAILAAPPSPTPAARRFSPATRARRSARPRSPASPPRSAASRPPASRPAPGPRRLAEIRPAALFGGCELLARLPR